MEAKPRMLTIRQIAREGILTEHALRLLLKAGKLPAFYIGSKALINFDKLLELLSGLKGNITEGGEQNEEVR